MQCQKSSKLQSQSRTCLFFFLRLDILFYLWFYVFVQSLFGCPGSLLLRACGLSLVVVSGDCFLALHRPLAAALLVVGHQVCGVRALVVSAHRLSYSVAGGVFPDQGSNQCPLLYKASS